MKKKGRISLYNIIFPIWMLWLFPLTWLFILPANFIIDSVVLLLALKFLKVGEWKQIYKRSVVKIWIFGFLADIAGAVMMLTVILTDSLLASESPMGQWWHQHLTNTVTSNPFSNIYSFLWTTICVAVSVFLIYLFNVKISFRKLPLKQALKRKLALVLAIFTAPYLFYLPTLWLY